MKILAAIIAYVFVMLPLQYIVKKFVLSNDPNEEKPFSLMLLLSLIGFLLFLTITHLLLEDFAWINPID